MPYSVVDKPSKYFNTVLYTGNGGTQSVTGVGFKPDFVWLKNRSNGAGYSNNTRNVVTGSSQTLITDTTAAEANYSAYFTSFDTDGFSLAGGAGGLNMNANTFVSWNWLASNTSGSSNTSGTITSTVSANTTSGFSIVSYTGNGSTSATVGHGLGVTPAMIIIKNRSAVSQWMVKHKSLATDYNLQLNVSDAQLYLPTGTGQGGVGNLSSSSTFGFTSGTTGVNNVNNSGSSFIAYCFAEVKGFSKAFSYTGNGSIDGTFVYCGFRPAWVMIKRTDSTANWAIFDNKRNSYNLVNAYLRADLSNAEGVDAGGSGSWFLDFLSNGFKLKENSSGINASGGTYIGIAFAENPFVSSKGIPTCAR